jgi:signal transduction histidine kinase
MLLMNLITNAFKYNESKVPRMDITFATEGRDLHIRFQDNGIGIPKTEIKKIFRKFYQIGQSDNMSAKGSGLGLYLVDTIVHLHKGRITAESKGSGEGSVFSLIFPLKLLTVTQ